MLIGSLSDSFFAGVREWFSAGWKILLLIFELKGFEDGLIESLLRLEERSEKLDLILLKSESVVKMACF